MPLPSKMLQICKRQQKHVDRHKTKAYSVTRNQRKALHTKQIESEEKTMKKMYEVETLRSNMTPKAFYNHCVRTFEKKAGVSWGWIDFEQWEEPYAPCEETHKHEDWKQPQIEKITFQPFCTHLYLEGNYNFIMEFTFWDEKRGSGYMYAMEIER